MPPPPSTEPAWQALYDVAASQEGCFTTRQAAAAGYSAPLLAHHRKAGRITRIRRGVYRLVHFPAGEYEDLVVAWLWAEAAAVLSHQTALSLHGISDSLPAQVHLTLPLDWQRRRLRVPKGIVLHYADMPDKERAWAGPVPVTSVRRTLDDCAHAGLTPDLLRQAARQALTRGLVTKTELKQVEKVLKPYEGIAATASGTRTDGLGNRRMKEIYISTDIESDGPIPGPHSMLSLGAAAYTADKVLISTFSANLETLPGAQPHPKTAEWWAGQPEAWAACRKDPETPESAMTRYLTWIRSLDGKPVFVAYPAGFDFLFVYWYLMKYVGESPFSHSALDIKSFAMALLKKNYRESTKRNMPRRWFEDLPHTHVALSDAIEQGALFCNMLKESRS